MKPRLPASLSWSVSAKRTSPASKSKSGLANSTTLKSPLPPRFLKPVTGEAGSGFGNRVHPHLRHRSFPRGTRLQQQYG